MKKIYKLVCLLVFAILIKGLPAAGQPMTVFIDTFNGETFPGTAGVPTTAYINQTVDPDFSGVQVGGADFSGLWFFNPGYLTAWSDEATGNDWAYTTGTLGSYAAPFTPVLSSLPGIITWEFNMRASIANNGNFGTTSNETAVVLAGSNPFFRNLGVGYAVTFTQSAPYSIQLVRYSAGLYGSLPVTILTGGVYMTDGTDYVSVRVTFDPTSSKWSLFLRDDGPFAFASPFSGVTSLLGSTVDVTYTGGSPALTNFGFFEYNSLLPFDIGFSEFDNFRVRVDCGIPEFTGPDTVCVGSSVTLANAVTGGTWSSLTLPIATAGATTGVITGVAAGTSIIRYSTIPGCFRDTVMRVRPLPAPISGPASVCVGSTVTLSDATPGGIWTTSDVSVASITSSGIVGGVAVGTAIILYTDPVTRCAIGQTETVNPVPSAITGNIATCRAATLTLSNTTPGGTWSSSNTGVATIGSSTGIVSGVSGGTATISYIITGTSCFVTTIVTINSTPAAITGPNIVCLGSSVTVSSATPGGNWTSSNTAVATVGATTGVITSVALGTTNITYTNPTTGCFTTRVESVNALPAAITGTALVCQSSTTTLSCTTPSGAWTSGNTAVATVNVFSGVVTGVAGGTATITYTVLGCSSTRIVTVNPQPAIIAGNPSICLGTTSTLSSSPGGTWTSTNTGVATVGASNGVVSGIALGTSTISYTLSTGCARTIVVSVNSLPSAITGGLIVCQGSTTDLDDATPGGGWTSGNTAVATIDPVTGLVTGVAGGTSTISYSSPTTCVITAVVTVNPLPAAISGPTAVCLGSIITLTDGTPGGNWSSSTPAVATVGGTTGYVTGVTVGTSIISYTLPTTGCQVTRIMTVNPLPDPITGATSVCVGFTTTLASTSAGGNWTSSNGAIATVGATSGIVTGNGPGTANISYTLGGCYVTRAETVNTTPSAVITPLGDTMLCPGDFVALTASSGSGFTYQWYSGAAPIPGAVSSTYITGTSGSYHVSISNVAGCNAVSSPMTVSVNAVVATITSVAGSFVTCTGSSIILDANTGVDLTYQWQLGGVPIPGVTTSSYTVTAGGDYTVIITNATGCSGSATATVTTNPVPAGTVILSGPLTFCQGSNVIMTAGSGYTYQWFNAAGPIAGATGMSFTATVAGSYYVTETNSFGCSATSPTSVVVVNPLPSAAIVAGGPTIFCTGGNVTLNATAGGGLTYQWYRNGTAISGATNASYVATLSGNYRVRVTNTATGCNALTPTDVLVTSVGTVTIVPLTSTTFCWGGSSLLATNVSGPGAVGVTYQWYYGGTLIVGATGSTYNASVPGGYSVEISIPSSCTQITAVTTVTEKPLPNPMITYNSTSHVLSAQSYYVSYQWFKNLVMIPGATASTTIATGVGAYKVQVTDTNGCQSFSSALPLTTFTGGGTAVVNVNTENIRVYPNPAQDIVHIESGIQVRAVISSVDGKNITEQSGTGVIDIDIHGLADGIYLLRLYHGDDQVKVEKVIKASR
jgi:uncharacterized protein YjdB